MLCIAFLVSGPRTLLAHATGEDYIFISFRGDAIDGRVEIHFNDLERKLGLKPGGGAAALAAVRANAPRVIDYINRHFSIGPEGGVPYTLEFTTQEVMELPQGTFAQFHFRASTGRLPDRLQVHHSMLYEGDDRLHRGLLLIEHNARTGTDYPPESVAMVFGPMSVDQTLDLVKVPSMLVPRDMVWQGVLHIWMGIDHVLFLIALMLPTVLVIKGDSWGPVAGFPRALWNLLKIVTVFTIAHSLTLLLAALGILDVPSRLVESAIALSIILVALNNITGRVKAGSLLAILGLGLFHGLGFATVMGHLPFRTAFLLRSVLGFNIGVELGQMAIVAILFPALFLLRKLPLYMPVVLKGGSFVLILVSSVWFVQRAFGLG
jgi:hypothetical protein